jgi:hypothetical protein
MKLNALGVSWDHVGSWVSSSWHALVEQLGDVAFWETGAKFAPVVTAMIAFLAALFAWLSIRAQRDTARRRAAIDFFLKTDLDQGAIALYDKFKRASRDLETRTAFDDGFIETEGYKDLRAFLNVCELIAVGIKQKAFSESISYAYWGDVLPRSYRDANILIQYIRSTPGEGTRHTYVDLERLSNRWNRKGAWRRRLGLPT